VQPIQSHLTAGPIVRSEDRPTRNNLQISRHEEEAEADRAVILPGLEPALLLEGDKAERQERRIMEGRGIAKAITGGRDLVVVQDHAGPLLVDLETGEVVEGGKGELRAERFAVLLALAAEERNHWTGMLQGKEGVFEGSGSFWHTSLRLDPNWMEAMRRRSRKEAHEAWRKMKEGLPVHELVAMKKGYNWRLSPKLLTCTMPHVKGKTSLEEFTRYNRAFELFRKRQEWKQHVWAGIKGVENALDKDGPHVHGHNLVMARYWPFADLSESWRECLNQATCELYGFGLAEDVTVFVNVKKVVSYVRNGETEVGWEDAVEECVKYVTKPGDLLDEEIPAETLLELAEVRRWPRMFELLGKCRKAKEGGREAALLDTACISDGKGVTGEASPVGLEGKEGGVNLDLDPEEDEDEAIKGARPPTWRDLMDVMPFSDWLRVVVMRAERGRSFRMRWFSENHPEAVLVTLDGERFGGGLAHA